MVLSNNQEPVKRYLSFLSLLQKQIAPRGVVSANGAEPVYNNGVHAFRNIDSSYLRQCMQPEELKALKGRKTALLKHFNNAFFGHVEALYFAIEEQQVDEFARMVVRLHLIDHLRIYIVDSTKCNLKDPLIVNLRGLPLSTVRKLLRWKKQYSPGFDGLIKHDRLDELIQNANSSPIRRAVAYSSVSLHGKSPAQRIGDITRWTLLFTKAQHQLFTLDQREELKRIQDDYRKWCLFLKGITDKTFGGYNFYFDCRLKNSLVHLLEENGCRVHSYPKETYVEPESGCRGFKLSRIYDSQLLDHHLLQKLAKVLLS